MKKLRNSVIALCLSLSMAFSTASAFAATQADASPSFVSFDVNDCVREPFVIFNYPTEVNPTSYVIQVSYASGVWVNFGAGMILGPQIRVLLQSKTQAGQLIKSIRVALRYTAANGAVSQGPWGTEVQVPETTVWTDGVYCQQKKLADAELAKTALLPGAPIFQSVKYFDNSTINAVIDRPTKVGVITAYVYEASWDGANWFSIDVSARALSSLKTSYYVTFKNPDSSKNLAFIRAKATNANGSGPWAQSQTGRPVGPSSVKVASTYSTSGYTLFTNPIALPGAIQSSSLPVSGCTYTSIELGELAPGNIAAGDVFKVETSLEDGAYAINSALQLDGQRGLRTVSNTETRRDITQIALRVQLCPQDIQNVIPRFLRVKVSRESDGEYIEGKISVLDSSNPLGSSIENSKINCGIGLYSAGGNARFDNNAVIEQNQAQSTASGYSVLKGTLFRSGLVAANQTIEVLKKKAGSYELLQTLKTDSTGQFTLKFNFPKSQVGTFHHVYLVAQESASGAGLLNEAFSAVEVEISLKWLSKGLTYVAGLSDWVPAQTSGCDTSLSQLSQAEDDERHPVAWFVAKKIYYGMKNKTQKSTQQNTSTSGRQLIPSSPSSSNWSSSSSGSISGVRKCYVRGYTTRTGKRVSGYYRSC